VDVRLSARRAAIVVIRCDHGDNPTTCPECDPVARACALLDEHGIECGCAECDAARDVIAANDD